MDLMGLPVGLGAFLAGMLMSETIYSHQVRAEIGPYALLFLSLFFISLGMGLNLDVLLNNWYIVVLGAVALVCIKFFALFMVARVRNIPIYDARLIALVLSQGGEFALLMFQTMKTSGISAVPPAHQEILTAIIILSMISTPFLLAIHDRIMRSAKLFVKSRSRQLNGSGNDLQPEVIICGFGRVGQIVAYVLGARKIPYVALDLDVNSIMMGRENGYNVFYGDSTNPAVLREFGLNSRRARAVVVALDNANTARNAVLSARSIAPRIKVFARARNLAESRALLKQGVQEAWPETIESSLMLARGVLGQLGISDGAISKLLDEMRSENYAELDNAITDPCN